MPWWNMSRNAAKPMAAPQSNAVQGGIAGSAATQNATVAPPSPGLAPPVQPGAPTPTRSWGTQGGNMMSRMRGMFRR